MTTPLRIITIREPWAHRLIHDGKDVENRARNIVGAYRGPILIHAAGRVDHDALTGAEHQKIRPGRLLGVVELIDVHHASTCADTTNDRTSTGLCSEWAEDDCFHLIMRNPRTLTEQISHAGGLGLRHITPDLAAWVWDHLNDPAPWLCAQDHGPTRCSWCGQTTNTQGVRRYA